jgi:hypothetical protein
MKKLLRSLLAILFRILLTVIWGALRICEIFFGQLGKWLKEYIQRIR